MTETIHTLVITDAKNFVRLSSQIPPSQPFHLSHAETLEHGLELMTRRCFDVGLLDVTQPSLSGLHALRTLQQRDPDLPIILLTNGHDEQLALQAVQAGAQDSLDQGQLTEALLIKAIRYAIERKKGELERRRLEAQIQYAQKLESLGVLAGGIAHDFNNLLMTIVARAGLALRALPPDAPGREHLKHIEKAGLRGGDLANQMLTYAGRGKPAIQAVNVSKLIEHMSHLLQISISKRATLTLELASHPPTIQADPAQIRQVVMNLVTNASEAINDHNGQITVATGTTLATTDEPTVPDWYVVGHLPPGTGVYIEVRDTGCGMSAETVSKIFDPFFTTKFTGRGLGLAALLGIVRAHSGTVAVKSQPGTGTAVRVTFPSLERVKTAPPASPTIQQEWRAQGTVLVVDDEEDVRVASQLILEEIGLQVLTANDGHAGLHTFQKHHEVITAVLLDLTMPGLTSEQLSTEMRRIKPHVPIILSSGYTEEEALRRFSRADVNGFIQKPYQVEALIEKVRQVLTIPQ
ncbi:MAG: response regulator [Nitrospirae bacterium]|nr:MAG: response regulator [Nitrospirota bacterium]